MDLRKLIIPSLLLVTCLAVAIPTSSISYIVDAGYLASFPHNYYAWIAYRMIELSQVVLPFVFVYLFYTPTRLEDEYMSIFLTTFIGGIIGGVAGRLIGNTVACGIIKGVEKMIEYGFEWDSWNSLYLLLLGGFWTAFICFTAATISYVRKRL